MTNLFKHTASAAVLVAALGAPALAQTFTGAPVYGELNLRSGSVSAGVRAAGAISADRLDPGCYGYISDAPTLVVSFQGGNDLYLSAGADEDTTMAVRGPNGQITCNDDGAGYPNPGVHLTNAPAGRYEIWLGTYAAGVGYPAATVHASTIGFDTENAYSQAPNPNLPADNRLSLRAGFRGDPRELAVTAGGDVQLDPLGDSCFGGADEAADLALEYRAGSLPLYIAMQSERDGVLAVRTPSGEMLCNDDQVGLDPGVYIADPQSGQYLVWAGLLSDGVRAEATLSISELGFFGVDNRLDLTAPARFGSRRLDAGFLPDPVAIGLQAGGAIDADQAVADGVVAEGYCAGYVTREPSFELDFRAGSSPLFLSVVSDRDTTLVVNGPDGAWFCNDDGGEGLNPELEFNPAQSGVYDIYVGSYSDSAAGADATLFISEIAGGGEPVPTQSVDLSLPALFGDHRLTAGFLPDPYVIDVEAGGPLDADESGVDSSEDWCSGNVTAAPTIEFDWTGSGGALAFYVDSQTDTTLAINMPDGSWRCNDDGGEGLNPALQFQNAPSGIYDVYVGTFGNRPNSARLHITEFDPPTD